MTRERPTHALIILDGWGIRAETDANAVYNARTPFLDQLETRFPVSRLKCSGNAVGLPDGVMGNSEVGHMNIGAGRKVFQDLVRINQAIKDHTLDDNAALIRAMDHAAATGMPVHLMGLVSDGGVHSHIDHLTALVDLAGRRGVSQVMIHAVLDGRDTPPDSGVHYIQSLETLLIRYPYARIATLCGRFYAMDRDTRWDRIQKAYDLYTQAEGRPAMDAVTAIRQAYDRGETDEFVEPITIETSDTPTANTIRDNHTVIFFNFRADRAREITRALTDRNFNCFNRDIFPAISNYVCMTAYDEQFNLPVAFPPVKLTRILGEEISKNGLRQLRIAETEKYAHVTYFFNGGDERVFKGEKRILIPSPREVATYDLKPEMSADEVARTACEQINEGQTDFVVINFANMDMVGHTGIHDAAVKACETVDRCVQRVVEAIRHTGGTAMVTADHGNAEQMRADNGTPHTAHTLNPVRFILAGERFKGIPVADEGILGDIAPTVLKLFYLPIPPEMTGRPLY